VASIDDPIWNRSYEDIYRQFSLQIVWYVVLGNHDYITNPQAEVEYSKKSARWHMPARYYSVKVPLKDDGGKQVLFVFLDTSPLIDKYYTDSNYSEHLKTQDTAAQMDWLKKILGDPDTSIRWKIVVGHHPLYTSGKRIKSSETLQFRKLMKPVFDKYKVDAYICGHEHQQEYLKPQGYTQYFISGSASEVRPLKGYLAESKFKASDHAFVVFSLTNNQMQLEVINWEGKILYQQTISHLR
jgi:3',5'-cyclic AMP phosphodiesterase CpdA